MKLLIITILLFSLVSHIGLFYDSVDYTFILLQVNDLIKSQGVRGQTLEILLTFTVPAYGLKVTEFGIKVLKGLNEQTVVGYNPSKRVVFLDRTKSSITYHHKRFPSIERAPMLVDNGMLPLQIFVDTSSVEVFANDGKVTITDVIFPKINSDKIELFSNGADMHIQSMTVYRMKSIWHEE